MNKSYNRYIEDKIKAFMNLLFKYGYNDYELKPMLELLEDAMRCDMIEGTITTYEYILITNIIENLYLYAKRVCIDLREK